MILLHDASQESLGDLFSMKNNKIIHVRYGKGQLGIAEEYTHEGAAMFKRSLGSPHWYSATSRMQIYRNIPETDVPKEIRLYVYLLEG